MSGYEPVVIDSFGGVESNYRANVPGKAIASSEEFVLGRDGRSVRARQGLNNLTSGAAAGAYSQLYVHSSIRLLAHRGTTLAAISDSTGGEVATTTVVNNFVHATRFGTPSASYSYIADASTALIRYDGTNFAAGTTSATVDGVGSKAMPKGNFLTVTGSSNRLVVAGTASSGGPNGATSGGSHVWFSDPGSGETWTSTNYVELDPGDGESIVGCCTWRDQVYVFKQTKMYIFYAEDTDAAGNPIFLKRSVSLPVQIFPPSTGAGPANPVVAAAPEGIYFVSVDGVWRTTGDVPVSISDAAWAYSRNDPSPITNVSNALTDSVLVNSRGGIHYHFGRVFVLGSGAQYVYDVGLDEWMIWGGPLVSLQTWNRTSSTRPQLVGASTLSNHVLNWSEDAAAPYTDDDGTAIGTRTYHTLFWDLGLPGEKSVREVELWGGGTVSATLYADYVASGGTTTSVNLGSADSATLSTRGIAPVAVTGTYFSLKITASAYFRIDRIIFHLRDAKNVGAKSS